MRQVVLLVGVSLEGIGHQCRVKCGRTVKGTCLSRTEEGCGQAGAEQGRSSVAFPIGSTRSPTPHTETNPPSSSSLQSMSGELK